MREPLAIQFSGVSKSYQLYGSQVDQLISVLGLQRIGIRPRAEPTSFLALKDIDLEVPRGHRLGIIGRNGAGKTTMLKLICGNVAPTSGTVTVNGAVQALMTSGTGFHPDHTGRENIIGALQYNGLRKQEYDEAIAGIIDFCELGEFIDQPFKAYSLGMQARLMFATATAIKPDILIVDEVLGAGDAYFVAKSRIRVEKLIQSGCTMLLVSHSMQQVMELCDEAIWLDRGSIRMQGSAFDVVKAYEEYIHGPIQQLENAPKAIGGETPPGEIPERAQEKSGAPQASSREAGKRLSSVAVRLLQEPVFVPNEAAISTGREPADLARSFSSLAPGGLSRWESDHGLKICGFEVTSGSPVAGTIVCLRPAMFAIRLVAETGGHYRCRYGIAIHDLFGRCMTRIFSPLDEFDIDMGSMRVIQILLNPNQVGPGEYTVGISVLSYAPLEMLNSSSRYDLLSRSFSIKVELPESLSGLESQFFHSAEWAFTGLTEEHHVED